MLTNLQINSFKNYLALERRASESTISSYLRDVSRFNDYLIKREISDLKNVVEEDVSLFLSQLLDDGYAPSSVSRIAVAIKVFFTYMADSGALNVNPLAEFQPPKHKKELPAILTVKEVELLINQPKTYTPKGLRDKAMLETMYATGVCVSELVALDAGDINLNTKLLTCRSGKERTIPLSSAAVKALNAYFPSVRDNMCAHPDERALFVNINGKRMSRQGLWKILKYYKEKAKIDKEITPHTLRHCFAAHMLANGADPKFLQGILGHADIASTLIYSKVVNKSLKDGYLKSHPRA